MNINPDQRSAGTTAYCIVLTALPVASRKGRNSTRVELKEKLPAAQLGSTCRFGFLVTSG
ncbi:hypothetical protein PAXRUDRAFT_834191 [Paxillus rubicundulus Ve08.2h10]|uniref:Uncharacterized protein n=1 Tax=Paxillus rubicundulus Ve08.2h10 TaxID=930991 RepID=A0A0D0DEG0_9AGAM|nr:hypothetical protein PAXRUDRAFT_834191 [Paxillus rubicundulus Ve08.2h10]